MSWIGPDPGTSTASGASSSYDDRNDDTENENVYKFLVVDSGPIIRRTGLTTMRGKAKAYYTVPAVMQEIRDAKAREHLGTLPFELLTREPSKEATQAVIDFSKKTGDFQSLSVVDLQVLALVYDLEKEGCPDMSHIRTTPKRTVGIGKIETLSKTTTTTAPSATSSSHQQQQEEAESSKEEDKQSNGPTGVSFFEGHDVDIVEGSDDDDDDDDDEYEEGATDAEQNVNLEDEPSTAESHSAPAPPKSWAALVNPQSQSSSATPLSTNENQAKFADQLSSVSFGKMNIADGDKQDGGQFSDAEEGEDEVLPQDSNEIEKELQSAFPSLQAAMTVPYEGSDDEQQEESSPPSHIGNAKPSEEELERRKKESLKPISNSGKMYNSFRKYGALMKPTPKQAVKKSEGQESSSDYVAPTLNIAKDETTSPLESHSRIIGSTMATDVVEDDGEGWISTTKDIQSMKSNGILDPLRSPQDKKDGSKGPVGPPNCQRAACTTTDFAMQNVLLQMNLELLSVDGIKIRRLKSWVTRCGACFKVYTNGTETVNGMKRLFCSHCGSDMMQRIAASVDGKTGRLRLHMSKKHKNNLRGTKFSLPKAGTGNRFQGDLLLREDQLLTGAWQQKVKMRSGGKARANAESMFGKDIAGTVGCTPTAFGTDDIRVGFGRRNPNAAKGRERRGKKKKSSDKACGLRRY